MPTSVTSTPPVAVVVPACDESDRIAATVAAAANLAPVDLVIVVDDGSRDQTATAARRAGAEVVRHQRCRGKAAAMVTGASYVAWADEARGEHPHLLLFLDADLGTSAALAGPLIEPIVDRRADMTVARLPAGTVRGGGRGRVVRLSRTAIARAGDFEARQPLSGQRCMAQATFQLLRPLAAGFGVETGLTIDALRLGLRVCEVDVPLTHRITGASTGDRLHRARQYLDVVRALSRRRLPDRRAEPAQLVTTGIPAWGHGPSPTRR